MADQDDDRWSVRGISKGTKDAAVAAARRADVSIGVWLSDAVDRAVRAEREPLDLAAPGSADNPADRSDVTSDGLALVERAVAVAIDLAGAPDVPKLFRARANRLLREALPASRFTPPPRKRRPPAPLLTADAPRACRVCGCTENDCSGCIERTGQACHWVEADLCSACVPAMADA